MTSDIIKYIIIIAEIKSFAIIFFISIVNLEFTIHKEYYS